MVYMKFGEGWKLEDLELFVEPIEVYDAEDKLVGLFVPANLQRGKELYAKHLAMLDPAEIERRRAEPGGRLFSEVIAELEKAYPSRSVTAAASAAPQT